MLSFLIALAASSGGKSSATAPDAAPPPPVDATRLAQPADAAPIAIDAATFEPTIRPDAPPSPSLYKVDTNPKGGSIRIGDQRRSAPARFALPQGKHTVIAELDGWQSERREIEIFAGVDLAQEIMFSHRVSKPVPPENGTLTVRTTPYSDVYIGTRKIGEAPFADYPLPPGTYTLVFKNPKHPSVRKTVTIVAGKLTKLPAFSLPER